MLDIFEGQKVDARARKLENTPWIRSILFVTEMALPNGSDPSQTNYMLQSNQILIC